MKKYDKKIMLLIIGVLLIVVGIFSVSMSYYMKVLNANKKYVITARDVTLLLNEGSSDITIGNSLPQKDENGKNNSAYTFSLQNMSSVSYKYTIYLVNDEISDESKRLGDEYVKYYLTNDSLDTQKDPALVSSLESDENGRILETGVITGPVTYNYELRFWLDYDATLEDAAGKTLSYRLNIEASVYVKPKPFVDTLEEKVDTTSTISFSSISSETNGRGIYKYTEDGEDIYYWRGAVADNHVIFGGYCWEMVRTTKTGGVKMIYDGTPVEANGVQTCPNTGNNSQLSVGNIKFNASYKDNAYVGYMYGLTGVTAEPSSPQCIKLNSAGTAAEVVTANTEEMCEQVGGKWVTTAYESTHANVVNSTIKGVIDTWFKTSNLNTQENLEKIEDAVYCNDRRIDTVSGYGNGLGYGKNQTAYMARNRFYINRTTLIPDLSCSKNDSFTVRDENGNGDLTYPVGLLTADEIVLAGGLNGSNNSDYYLYTGQNYWALSPYEFSGSGAYGFYVDSGGYLRNYYVDYTIGVRPVVSLAASTPFASGGDGSETAPYVVE